MSRHSSVAEAVMDDLGVNAGANDDYAMVQPAVGKSIAPVVSYESNDSGFWPLELVVFALASMKP